MNRGIGRGTISVDGEDRRYSETLPFDDGEEVIIVRKSDIEAMVSGELEMLLAHQTDMPQELFDVEEEDKFPDELDYYTNEGIEFKLFLDRHFYSPNCRDQIWVRYTSVDMGFIEDEER